MPILAREPELYPTDLLDYAGSEPDCDRQWWAIYTRSRREKDLMRRLVGLEVPFYGPLVAKRTKSPAGRIRTSYVPLFQNYVFVYGDDEARYTAVTTGCVSRCVEVTDNAELTHDLRQFYELIKLDIPLTPEARFQPGRRVRVRAGRFQGFEGTIIRREGETRLLVAINFIQQGASLQLEDFEVEAI